MLSELCTSWCRMRNWRLQPQWGWTWAELPVLSLLSEPGVQISVPLAVGTWQQLLMPRAGHTNVALPQSLVKALLGEKAEKHFASLPWIPVAPGVRWVKPAVCGVFCQTQGAEAGQVCWVPVKPLPVPPCRKCCRGGFAEALWEESLPSHQALPSIDSFC